MPKPKSIKTPRSFVATVRTLFVPKKRRWLLREMLVVVGAILAVVVVAQLAYPSDRTLPFTKVADVEIGGLTKREAIDYLFGVYGSSELTVKVADTEIKTTTDKAGVLVDFQKAADATARYPWWQRLVPFSLFYKSLVINARPEITVDEQLAKQFTLKVQAACAKAVREASVVIDAGKVALKQGADGRKCTEAAISDGLASALLRHGSAQVTIASQSLRPTKTTALASEQVAQAQQLIDHDLTVVVKGIKHRVPPEVVAGWVGLADDPTKGTFTVELRDSAIRSYLETHKPEVYVAPLATIVHTMDGTETHREQGRPGQDIDYDKAIAAIKQELQYTKSSEVSVALQTSEPPLHYLHNYSQSQQGLDRLLADISARKGRNYAVVVTELGGMGRAASVNGDRTYVMASTYKLFIAYMVLKDLESGALKWDDVITNGLTVRQCFEEMIVRSANRCALAYKARYGADKVVSKMRELGFASVEHNSTWWATANDLAKYMKQLERGQLLEGESREFLLGLLKRQVWRYGIPTGIPQVTVADKVGFLEDYIHDTAIVYSPKGAYVLTIMTKGGSYGGMADVARQVHRYMMQ